MHPQLSSGRLRSSNKYRCRRRRWGRLRRVLRVPSPVRARATMCLRSPRRTSWQPCCPLLPGPWPRVDRLMPLSSPSTDSLVTPSLPGAACFDAVPEGHMLFYVNDDVPGIIGTVGSILGDHQVNIAQMTVGRPGEQPGGTAIGALNLDTTPPAAAISQLSEHPSIRSVQVIQLPLAGQIPPWLPQ